MYKSNKEFIKGHKYVFAKELWIKDLREYNGLESEINIQRMIKLNRGWVDKLDGLVFTVEIITPSNLTAYVGEYMVSRDWCVSLTASEEFTAGGICEDCEDDSEDCEEYEDAWTCPCCGFSWCECCDCEDCQDEEYDDMEGYWL